MEKQVIISFEQLFAKQMAVMTEKFPKEITDILWGKKELLFKKVESLNLDFESNSSLPFIPVIPTRKMKIIEQMAHFMWYSQSSKAVWELSTYFQGFLENERLASDMSSINEVGFLLDIKFPSIFGMTIPENTVLNSNGRELRKKIQEDGYSPLNHAEAFTVAYLSDKLAMYNQFCALNFSWDGYEFANIFHARGLKYGIGWFTPHFNKKGECQKPEGQADVFVPIFKEAV